MYNLSKEELREVQLKSLELFKYFKEVCEKENLTTYFCGGCCIGTIRHKGFIPWDDDVDVFMPRDDYEKLVKIWDKYTMDGKYPIHRTGFDDGYEKNIFSVITDRDTTFIKTERAIYDIDHGIALDVIPLDGAPESKFKQRIQTFWALVYSLYCANEAPVNHGKLVTAVGKIGLAIIPGKKLKMKVWKCAERHMTKYKIKDSKYIRELCSGPRYMMNVFPKEIFDHAIYKEFEGEQMPIPVGYDEYLRIVFGDYMQMPPADKQNPHHYVEYCDMHNGYEKYRGVYYYKNKGEN